MSDSNVCPSCTEPINEDYPECPLSCKSKRCKYYALQLANVDFSQKPIVWVLGGPGSGKGTQCDKIIKQFGFTHVSSGDLLRAEVKRGTRLGKEISELMAQGNLVPNDIVLTLIRDAMAEKIDTAKGFLIDGYPREQAQGIAFEERIAPCKVIICFDASLEEMTKRLLNRGLTSGRSDDNKDSIKLRLQTFMENNEAVLVQYPSKVHRINADRPVEEVYAEVERIMKPIADGTFCSKG